MITLKKIFVNRPFFLCSFICICVVGDILSAMIEGVYKFFDFIDYNRNCVDFIDCFDYNRNRCFFHKSIDYSRNRQGARL